MSWMILLMPEKKKFVYQDGTIPPLFKPMSNTPDGVPEDWRVGDETD